MWLACLLPFLLQAAAIGVDEIVFHRKRGLPRWERIGHPLDTLTVVFCMGYVLFVPYSKSAILPYAVLAIFSCLMVTKDEFVHKEHCPGSEHWLHALLFLLHPVVLASAGLIWPASQEIETIPYLASLIDHADALRVSLSVQFAAMLLFMSYQILYWNFIWKKTESTPPFTKR
jgi:hypothetical protein